MIVPVVDSCVLMNCMKYFMSGPTFGNRDKLKWKKYIIKLLWRLRSAVQSFPDVSVNRFLIYYLPFATNLHEKEIEST